MHPVYTSHLKEIHAVYNRVAKIYTRNEKQKHLKPEDAAFVRDLFAELGRIYLLFAQANAEVIRVTTEDFETIKRICRFYGQHMMSTEA